MLRPVFLKHFLQTLALLCILCGFLCSFAAMSIGMLGFILFSFLDENAQTVSGMITGVFSPGCFGRRLKKLRSHKFMIAPVLFFIVVLASGLHSENKTAWAGNVLMKLPFLFLPMALVDSRPFSKKNLQLLFAALCIITSVAAACVLFNYVKNYNEVNSQLLKGTPMWTPMRNHIRFSLLLALVVVVGVQALLAKDFFDVKWQKSLAALVLLFLTVMLHLLSVRSGLLALYIGIAVIVVLYIVRSGKWLTGLGAVCISVVLAVAAVNYVPSLRNKISYARWSWQQYKQNDHTYYSDVSRFMNLDAGWQLAKQHMITGVGYGDVQQVCDAYFQKNYPDVEKAFARKPHNQFLYVWLASGIVGLLLFCISVFAPLFFRRLVSNPVFLSVQLMLASSFLFDHTLETQAGVCIYILPLMLLMWHSTNGVEKSMSA